MNQIGHDNSIKCHVISSFLYDYIPEYGMSGYKKLVIDTEKYNTDSFSDKEIYKTQSEMVDLDCGYEV